MAEISNIQPTVIRTGRGLSIAGTRITLYNIMEYIKDGASPSLIQERFNLTAKQITDVLDYIQAHQEEVEAEYRTVLQQAQEIRHYWENRNQERLAKIAAMPPKPEHQEIRAKLRARQAQRKQAA